MLLCKVGQPLLRPGTDRRSVPPPSCLQARAGKAQLEAAKQELSTATAELRSARVGSSRQAGAVCAEVECGCCSCMA